jgi:putative radical SAM enzyme (TIGR03279 family)
VNGHAVQDVLDYTYYTYNARLFLELRTPDGRLKLARVRKAEGADLGLTFETYLMDGDRSCANRCIFCCIDQLPPGMRGTLYYKDDDARLSFLQGNYVTLTNLSEREIRRVIDLRISPLNVSVHSMNPELRAFLLGSPNGARGVAVIRRLAAAGITLNCQIVCCPGINDGEELRYSMAELAKLHPAVASVSVVPVGLTKHRAGLYPLEPYDAARAAGVIGLVEAYAARCLKKRGSRIFYCADEFYIKAGLKLPEEASYEGYPQLENGVGMLRSLLTEFEDALADSAARGDAADGRPFTIVTGRAAEKYLQNVLYSAREKYAIISGSVLAVTNTFFGESVDVAGLLTGGDIIRALGESPPRGRLLLPRNMLRRGEDCFLDGVTLRALEAQFGAVRVVEQDGSDLLQAILGH